MLGWLMYRSGLVPRRMALFGVVGGPLLAASGIAVLLGLIPQGSTLQSLATVPEIIWEVFLGLWLTFKGFSRSPVLTLVSREQGIRDQAFASASSFRRDRNGPVDSTQGRWIPRGRSPHQRQDPTRRSDDHEVDGNDDDDPGRRLPGSRWP